MRIYAPVGGHEDLLAYLVRRLLENGANTSFVNRIADETRRSTRSSPIRSRGSPASPQKPHPRIPLPRDLYGAGAAAIRAGSTSPTRATRRRLREGCAAAMPHGAAAQRRSSAASSARGEARRSSIRPTAAAQSAASLTAEPERHRAGARPRAASAARLGRDAPAPSARRVLEQAADLFEASARRLMALVIREGGRTIPDALAEVREAVDFLRYYAARARADFAAPQRCPGPTGERNELALHGRGVFACISPWNFPLAIFTGQVAAALAAGNAVIAKPAEQTPLIAAAAVRLLHQAGVPGDVLHLLPGDGEAVGARARRRSAHRRRRLHRLDRDGAARSTWRSPSERGPIVPLIAETGGIKRDDRRFLGAARAGRRATF